LDEHDVNAFEVYAGNDPFLLCTTMTHTPGSTTTKANTCYTAGARFLEEGEEIFVRDLEPERYSILLPAHSFFGVIQLSAFKG
jgi:hypothetical protein